MDFRYPDKPTHTTPESVSRFKVSEYIGQGKYDGWRCQIYRDGGWHLLTRMGESIINHARVKFPATLMETVKTLEIPEGSVLDGEFVGPRGTHKPAIYIFDCLKWAGEWLGRKTYEERWAICQRLLLGGKSLVDIASICPNTDVKLAWTFTTNFLGEFDRLKAEWLKSGRGMDFLYEGIVLKWRKGRLVLDRSKSVKSNSMFKLKFRDIGDQRY